MNMSSLFFHSQSNLPSDIFISINSSPKWHSRRNKF